MVTIKSIKINGKFRYLWLKYVNGVNLSQHCAKCLVGPYSKKIKPFMEDAAGIELDESEAKAYYLCGVSMPYVWKNNFHLAFIEKPGSVIEVCENGIDIVVENAERIRIAPDYIDESDENAHKKAYCTCRNWQFAYQFEKGKLN